jgi:hypothetical protein
MQLRLLALDGVGQLISFLPVRVWQLQEGEG